MGLGKHRNVFPCSGILLQFADQLFYQRIHHLFQAFFYRKGNGGVVDILTRQAEMNEFFVGVQTADLVKFFLDIIFDGFHIVIRHLLNVFHALGTLFRQLFIDAAKAGKQSVVETLQLGKRYLTQTDEILYLYTDAVADQCIF